jgi:hypothetical protein
MTILCLGIYLLMGFGSNSVLHLRNTRSAVPLQVNQTNGYATEQTDDGSDSKSHASVGARRAANAKELDRLAKWSEELKLKKRDLLRSDVEGNKAYEAELAEYNQALAKANAEREGLGLGPSTSGH